MGIRHAAATDADPLEALPWRAEVAAWSIERRQRWGDRAGELQDAGAGWIEAERIAFASIEGGADEPIAEAPSPFEQAVAAQLVLVPAADIWGIPVPHPRGSRAR